MTESQVTVEKHLENWKKRVSETSIHISDVHKDVKTKFMQLAKEYFKNHYGITLKYLIDVANGLQLSPQHELLVRIETLEKQVESLKNKSELEEPEQRIIKMANGKIVKIGG